mmetsp:Transcript_86161/g.257149  ORF Transcript_86161/g.257149 Transcript_86161/m.257149 type:complete len:300 (-) Transcript_86161:539-1438(-)
MAKASSAALRACLDSPLVECIWASLIKAAASSFFAPAATKSGIDACSVFKAPSESLICTCNSEMTRREDASPFALPWPLKRFIAPMAVSNAPWKAFEAAFTWDMQRMASTTRSVADGPASFAMSRAACASRSASAFSLRSSLMEAPSTVASSSPILSKALRAAAAASAAGAAASSGLPLLRCSWAILYSTAPSSFVLPICFRRSISCWAMNTASSFDPIFMNTSMAISRASPTVCPRSPYLATASLAICSAISSSLLPRCILARTHSVAASFWPSPSSRKVARASCAAGRPFWKSCSKR